MRKMDATRFKEQCLSLLDNLDHEGIVITRHGRPVARLVPFQPLHADLIGCLENKLLIKQDILSTGRVWPAGS